MKKQKLNPADFEKIVRVIEDYIFEKHKVCGLDEISSITGLSRSKCAEIILTLLGQKQIYEIFSGNGKPKLYIPYDMMQGILTLQKKPDWINGFQNEAKAEILSKIEELNKKKISHETFERLLYATDKPLEKAVAFALEFLEFRKVVHVDQDDKHDVEFEPDNREYILEVKGKGDAADKDNVLQLRGWIDKKINEGSKSDKLVGMLVVNHYRYDEPKKRKKPLTQKAVEFMRMNHFKLVTTTFIYKLIQDVLNKKISKEDARKKILVGESYG